MRLVFSNARLARADNARFAYDIFWGAPVAFDEGVNGYVIHKSFWAALPPRAHAAIWLLLATILLGLVGSTVRFAPALETVREDERDSSDYIRSMARLLARGRAAKQVVEDTAESVSLALKRRFGAASQTDPASLAERIDDGPNRSAFLELDRLRRAPHLTDADVLRAAILGARLRKDYE